jgi:hypothetical protein
MVREHKTIANAKLSILTRIMGLGDRLLDILALMVQAQGRTETPHLMVIRII